MPVSKEVIFKCLNGYMEGTMWTEPPVCAVCSQYDRDAADVRLSGDILSFNLDFSASQTTSLSKVRRSRHVNMFHF